MLKLTAIILILFCSNSSVTAAVQRRIQENSWVVSLDLVSTESVARTVPDGTWEVPVDSDINREFLVYRWDSGYTTLVSRR